MSDLVDPNQTVESSGQRTRALSEELAAWRERLLNSMLYAAAALGLPAVVFGSITAIRDGQVYRVGVFAVAYAFVLVITFGKRWIAYTPRAASLVLIAYALGLDSLRTTALAGSGRVFLIAFAILGTLLFGLRGGVFAVVLSVLTTAAVGWGISAGLLPISPDVMAATDWRSWLTGGTVFTLLASMLVVALGTLQRGVQVAFLMQRRLVASMEEQQGQLEKRVEERTRELERQATQLRTAADIAKLSTEADDLENLLANAVELIRDRFGFYHASVFLLDPSGSWAELAASTGEAGKELLARKHKLAVGSASIIGWVTANRMPRVTPDVDKDPFYYKNPSLPKTRAEMAVPLMAGQRLIGAFDVQSTDVNAFGETDIRVVEAIAGELAFAIDNARLSRERQAQMSALEGEAHERIRESWAQYARAGAPTIIHMGTGGDGGETEGAFAALDDAATRGETVVSDDGTEVVVPVRVRGETIAAIGARKPNPTEQWSEEDIAMIQAVAGQAALAMETARQYAEERRRVAELEVVNRVSQAASQLLRLDTLLRMVGRQIRQVMGDTDIMVGLFDEERQEIHFPFALEAGEEVDRDALPLGQGLESLVVRSRQPLILLENAGRVAAELGARLEGEPPKSYLGVPMMVGDQIIGLLVVKDQQRERRFTDEDAALLSTIAGQVATALQNARLLEQVQRAARRERLVHEISSKVRQAPDVQTVLETTAREIGRAFNAARASVRIGNGPEDRPEPPRGYSEGRGDPTSGDGDGAG